MIDITIATNSGPVLLAGQLGTDYTSIHSAQWGELSQILGFSAAHAPVIYFNKKGYLPKVYQKDGEPVLVWGGEIKPLKPSDKLNIRYVTGNTNGFANQPHAELIFSTDGPLASADEVFMCLIPIGTHYDKTSGGQFMALVQAQPKRAFLDFVQQPDPTMGLEYLDTLGLDTTDLEVMVEDIIVRTSQTFGSEYATARVIFEGMPFKVRCGRDVTAIAALKLRFPEPVKGYVSIGKTYLNLKSMDLTVVNMPAD